MPAWGSGPNFGPVRSEAHLDRSTAHDQALRAASAPESGAPSSPGRTPHRGDEPQADPDLGPRGLRKDHAPERVADDASGRRVPARLDLAGGGGQRPDAVPLLPGRRAAGHRGGRRRGYPGLVALTPAASDRIAAYGPGKRDLGDPEGLRPRPG